MFLVVVTGIYLPLFSSLQDRPPNLRARFKDAYWNLFIFTTLLSLGLSIFAGPIFVRLFGASYLPGADYFRVLAWQCIFVFLNTLMLTFHYAQNDHRILVLAMASAVVVELVLDVCLIPRYGTVVASWARLAGESVNFGVQASAMIRKNMSSISDLVIQPAAIVGACLACLALMNGHLLAIQWLGASATFIAVALVFRFFRGPAADAAPGGAHG